MIFELDRGSTVPFALSRNGLPWDLTGAAAVDLILEDTTVLPLSVTDAKGGLCQFIQDGRLRGGFRRANVRVTYDPTHIYHLPTFQLRVSVLFGT